MSVCPCHFYMCACVFGSPISISPVLVYVSPLCKCINIIITIIGICVTVICCLCVHPSYVHVLASFLTLRSDVSITMLVTQVK